MVKIIGTQGNYKIFLFLGRLIGKLHEMRKSILRPDNCFAFLSADIELLTRTYGNRSTGAWIDFFSEVPNHRTTDDDLSIPFRTISGITNKNT
jgi:hypothetical protein